MPKRNPTHYEVLGLSTSAKHTEVGLAFNRKMSARRREDAPPDPRGESMLKEAFAVLSDLDRRAEYDAQLRAAALKPAFGKNHAAIAALFVVIVGAGLFWYLHPRLTAEPIPEVDGKSHQEILNGAIPAIGKLRTLDMSGQPRPAGIAFTVEEGVAVTSCQGLSPNAQLSLALASREVPANITESNDEMGLCKLEVRGAGTWPLSVSSVPAKPGDRVYITQLNGKGDVMLLRATVRTVKPQGTASVIDIAAPVPPEHGGSPLLDRYGRVVAVANLPPDGKGSYVAIPPSWGETVKPSTAPPPKADEPEADPAAADPGGIDDFGRTPEQRRRQEELVRKIDPAKRERLEKAFVPKSVPEGL